MYPADPSARSLFISLPAFSSMYMACIYIRRVLLTVWSILDVHQDTVDCRPSGVTRHVEWPGQTRLNPDVVPRPEQTEKHVCELHAICNAVELVFTRVSSESQEDLLSVSPLACRYVGCELGAAGLQSVLGWIHHTVVSWAGIYGAAALVPEICSREAVGLGREQIDKGEGNGIDLGLLAMVQKGLLFGSLALVERMVSPALPLISAGTVLRSRRHC